MRSGKWPVTDIVHCSIPGTFLTCFTFSSMTLSERFSVQQHELAQNSRIACGLAFQNFDVIKVANLSAQLCVTSCRRD